MPFTERKDIIMRKIIFLLLTLIVIWSAFAFAEEPYRVAMITDYADITDQSFNQTCYEACKSFCDANSIDFTYYKPKR